MSSRQPQTNDRGHPHLALRGFGAIFALTCLLGILLLSDESPTLQRFRHHRGVDGTKGSVKFDSSSTSTAKVTGTPSIVGDDAEGAGDDQDNDDGEATATSEEAWRLFGEKTWAETEEGRGCRSLLPKRVGEDGDYYAPSAMWMALRDRTLNASYYPPEHAHIEELQQYVNTIFTFYTTARLRRSAAHPAPLRSVRRIVDLVDNYKRKMKQYNDHQERVRRSNTSSSEPPDDLSLSPPDPIRILVLGGSVTVGTNSQTNKVLNLTRIPRRGWDYYAWSPRLEYMLNGIFFPGEEGKGFSVFNFASSSTNSEVGAAVVGYQLIPGIQENPPDIIIAAYSTNDSFDPDRTATFHEHEQNLIRAMHNTRPCDDDLPLVILADDMHGRLDADNALETTGSLYKLASWYNVMAVSYENVVRHASIASYVNITHTNPLFGTGYDNLHLGMGMHIGVAWTLLFNLMVAFHDACTDFVDNGGPNSTLKTLDSIKWSLVEPPTKYQAPISRQDEASREWKKRLADKARNCPQPHMELGPYSTRVCAYAWMSNSVTMAKPSQIDAALKSVLRRTDGWKSGSFLNGPHGQLPVFGTETNRSSFRLVLRNVTQETQYLTIVSMQTYGERFSNALLRLSVRIVRRQEGGAPVPPSKDAPPADDDDEASFEIKGNHHLMTSVYFPHKLRLPGPHGARVGDTIRVDAVLVSGSAFKIQGIMFCQS